MVGKVFFLFFVGSCAYDDEHSAMLQTSTKNNGSAAEVVLDLKRDTYAKAKEQCQTEGKLFEDPDFPAADGSLFSKKPRQSLFKRSFSNKVVWKRPKDIVANPRFVVGGASRFDVAQGLLDDDGFLAAVAALSQYSGMLQQAVPPQQSFEGEYCGVFRFRFWQNGRLEEVIVDDRLPTYKNKLVFVHSPQDNEFWSALLEKAYAKLHGSYEALQDGKESEAMEDLTGGITETFRFAKRPELFNLMMEAQHRQSLMCSSIPQTKKNKQRGNGLSKGVTYSITGVYKLQVQGKNVELIRCRNPEGNKQEWTGAWSDGSPEWKRLSERQKEEVGPYPDDDGEFFMSFDDYIASFSNVKICKRLGADTHTQIEFKAKKYSAKENEATDKKLKPYADTVAGKDGEIDAVELQQVVNRFFRKDLDGRKFSLDACGSMLSMVDRDRNGKLEYTEFRELIRTMKEWKKEFNKYDFDKSGDINAEKLHDALSELGFVSS